MRRGSLQGNLARSNVQDSMTHRVSLGRPQLGFDVEDGETVLAAGLRQGFALPFGCQTGACASCRVRLLGGTVQYPPDAPPERALSRAEIDAGYILMCEARPTSDLELLLHQPEPAEHLRPRKVQVRVIDKTLLSHDVLRLRVQLPHGDGGEPFRYQPGQYADFLLDGNRRRSFSIASAPSPGGVLEFHLRVTPGGQFAHFAQDQMPGKAILRLEGPLGAFYFRPESDRPVLLMAGGTGFAPVKAIVESQLAPGLTRPFHLFWGARGERDLYLDALPRQWEREHGNFRYTPVLSEPAAGWNGERGFVHEALLRAYPKLARYDVYMAGPPIMVHKAREAFLAAGLDADHLYYDSFDYAYETWPGLEKK